MKRNLPSFQRLIFGASSALAVTLTALAAAPRGCRRRSRRLIVPPVDYRRAVITVAQTPAQTP